MENKRLKYNFRDTSQRYQLTDEDYEGPYFQQQYYHFYQARLRQLQPRVLEAARKVYGPKLERVNFSDVVKGRNVFIIGTLIKVSKNRPSVFTEFEEKNFVDEANQDHDLLDIPVDTATVPTDTMWIESEKQRFEVMGNFNKDEFCVGYVVGFYGQRGFDEKKFHVERTIFPEPGPQSPFPEVKDDIYLIFMSGINIDSKIIKNESVFMALNQMIEWLHGPATYLDEELAGKVVRVIVAGNTIKLAPEKDVESPQLAKIGETREYDESALELADKILEDMATIVDVDLISGPNDVCPTMWPQTAMYKQAFRGCCQLAAKKFNTSTNPCSFAINDVEFLGTSGQNLTDLLRYTRDQPPEKLMIQMLNASHVCPTCPNTIDGFPFTNRDPFVLHELPHVFFAGNQDRHICETVELENGTKTVLLTIPKFCETFEVVLFNLKTMQTKIVKFGQEFVVESH